MLKVKDPVTGAYTFQGLYEGAIVQDVDPENLEHHLNLKMVEEVADPAGARSDKDQGSAKGRRAAHDDD